MANIIRVLPEFIANQIAAGEVVQRPESVVKELIENSIDAEATHITVVLKDAGKTLIQIIDNGKGMSADDAKLAFERHATSKIAKQEDLIGIMSLGFRGEALASIASVSQTELKTKQAEDKIGILVRVGGGVYKEIEPVAMTTGTHISVKNLFFNTPGRRNFLKSDNVEFRHILETVQKYALFYFGIRWTLISDNDTVFDVVATDSLTRIGQLFGERVKSHMLEVNEKTELLDIFGYIAKPDVAKKTRGEQYLFINGRAIIHKSIQHAIFNSYGSLLPHGTYPFYIIFLTIDPKRVDINVHPAKQEVKFDDERSVYAITMSVMKKALAAHDLVPHLSGGMTYAGSNENLIFDPKKGFSDFPNPSQFVERPSSPISNAPYINPNERVVSLPFDRSTISTDQPNTYHGLPEPIVRSHGEPEFVLRSFATEVDNSAIGERRIWQVHNKYIFSQIVTGLMIIDQHVAHERILYEEALKNMNNNYPFTQQLLFPHTLDLSAADFELLKTIQDDMVKLGFSLKFFSGRTVVIDAVPSDVKQGSEQKILQDILNQYREFERDFRWKGRENLAASFACRSAIKAGDPLKEIEMKSLIDRLFACQNPYTCPHGRPIVVKMSLSELDIRFGRTMHP